MTVAFQCPCGQRLKARDDQAGETVRCPACDQEVTVPDEAEGGGSSAVRADEDRPRPARASAERSSGRRGNRDEDDEDRPRRRRQFEDDDEDDEDDGYEMKRRPAATSSGMATASLILSLVSFFCFGIVLAVPAIVLGILGLRQISNSRGRVGGKGLAVAGIILGSISLLLNILVLVYVFSGNTTWGLGGSAARMKSSNNLKIIGLAMHNSIDVNGGQLLPRGAITSKDGRPLLSWRVALLPYVEQDGLYRQFHLDEPWDSPHNQALIPLMPKVYAHPAANASVTAQGMTHYRAVTGPQSAFEPRLGQAPRFPMNITDGTVNTILAAEATDPVIWTKPDELDIRPGAPLPRLGLTPGKPFQVLMWDGSVRTVSPKVSPATLQAAMTANGGEILGPDW